MKSSKFVSFFLVLVALGLIGIYFYQSNRDGQDADLSDATNIEGDALAGESIMVPVGSYEVRIDESRVGWYGDKILIPGGDHAGTIAISEGSLTVDESGLITDGVVVVDMTAIKLAEGDTGGQQLLDHFASDDFFSTKTYPTAELAITGSEEVEGGLMVMGDLTIKDISNPVDFVVTATEGEMGVVRYSGTLVFDRAAYDVRFGSGRFFDNLGDNVIGDDIELTFTLVTQAVPSEEA